MLKTFQASEDEKAEREENDALARREQVMLDLAAAQQDSVNAEAREDAEDMEDGNEERDLDDEVPEAEADESDMSASEDESGSEAEEGDTTRHTADVTFNEDSFIEGSMLESQVSQMLAMEEASMSGTLQEERDLDDDVPEAGSYEHTDSSLIDSSSEGEGPSSAFRAPPPPPSRRRSNRRSSGTTGIRRHLHSPSQNARNSRLSVEYDGSSSILDGSSFLRSSPAAARGSLRGRLFGARGR